MLHKRIRPAQLTAMSQILCVLARNNQILAEILNQSIKESEETMSKTIQNNQTKKNEQTDTVTTINEIKWPDDIFTPQGPQPDNPNKILPLGESIKDQLMF